MPRSATSQKGSNKKHTPTTGKAASTGQFRVRQATAAAAKKNSRRGGKPRKKLSHQQTTETRDLLDAEFREFRVKSIGQQEELRQRGGAATTAGFSAHVSEGSVQDLASIMGALRAHQ